VRKGGFKLRNLEVNAFVSTGCRADQSMVVKPSLMSPRYWALSSRCSLHGAYHRAILDYAPFFPLAAGIATCNMLNGKVYPFLELNEGQSRTTSTCSA